MQKNEANIIPDHLGVGYSDHTLMKGSPIRGSYSVKDGTELIKGIAFRKQEQLSALSLPEGLLSVGDASFSFCKALKEVTIPASVKYIGVAAFSCSGLECVTFLGTPKVIDREVFLGCNNLKRIIVPIDEKQYFIDSLGKEWSFAIIESTTAQRPVIPDKTHQSAKDLFGEVIVKRSRLYYNQQQFNWTVDDEVKLSELFSGFTFLLGDPSYQFRKKVLFVFIKSGTAQKTNLNNSSEYPLAANVTYFKQKYEEKYGHFLTPARIFIFVCDDNEHARFYDEATLVQITQDAIRLKSIIRFR